MLRYFYRIFILTIFVLRCFKLKNQILGGLCLLTATGRLTAFPRPPAVILLAFGVSVFAKTDAPIFFLYYPLAIFYHHFHPILVYICDKIIVYKICFFFFFCQSYHLLFTISYFCCMLSNIFLWYQTKNVIVSPLPQVWRETFSKKNLFIGDKLL